MKKLTVILLAILLALTGCAGQYVEGEPALELRACDYTEDAAVELLSDAVYRVNQAEGPGYVRLTIVDCADGPWWARANVTQDIHSGTGLSGTFWTGSALYVNADTRLTLVVDAIYDAIEDDSPVQCESANAFGCE